MAGVEGVEFLPLTLGQFHLNHKIKPTQLRGVSVNSVKANILYSPSNSE